MGKKLYVKKIKTTITQISSEGILPFEEKPSTGCFQYKRTGEEESIGAHDLFSLFTADIIKEEIIFPR